MSTLVFRTAAPFLVCIILLFSLFVLLRGHNEPGGGFIGGLIAASAFAVNSIAYGLDSTYKSLYFHPVSIASFGLLVSAASGLLSIFVGKAYLTGLWLFFEVAGIKVVLSTPLVFDIGVYLVVVGTISAIVLRLEEGESE